MKQSPEADSLYLAHMLKAVPDGLRRAFWVRLGLCNEARPDGFFTFIPQAAYEQAAHRSALIIGTASYNGKTGLMVRWPLSTEIKGHPFEVVTRVDGVDCLVLSNQVESLDWKIRRAKKKAVVTADVMVHVRAKLKALLQIPG